MKMFVICIPLFFPRYFKGDQTKQNETGGHVARMEEIRNMAKVLIVKHEGKKLIGICKRKVDLTYGVGSCG
jgi:hypothetical protein